MKSTYLVCIRNAHARNQRQLQVSVNHLIVSYRNTRILFLRLFALIS